MNTGAVHARQVFSRWIQLAEAVPQPWQAISAKVALTVSGENGGTWLVDSSQKPALQASGDAVGADSDIAFAEDSFLGVIVGRTDLQSAFRAGGLRVAGRLEAVLQCNRLFEILVPRENVD